MKKLNRLSYIDNIKVFLTVIVILHHIAITYGAPGGWYYREFELYELDPASLAILVIFAASNQAYFMGFFYFLSGFFSGRSLMQYNPRQFITQRFLRLGIPIILFVTFVSPILRLIIWNSIYELDISLDTVFSIYKNLGFGIELGPMWFVLLLLILSIFILIIHGLMHSFSSSKMFHLNHIHIILFALSIGIINFFIRIRMPIGTVFQPINLQTPFTFQYLSLFFAGYVAYHQNWFDQLDQINRKSWLLLLLVLILMMPAIYYLSGGLKGDLTPALGGLHWQSAFYSIWEQLFCVSVMCFVISFFFDKLNNSSIIHQELALSSYATFFIHPLILVGFSILIKNIHLHPLLKITLTAGPAIILCFLSGSLLRRLPGLRKIL
jgi:hypothetical protein